MKKLFVTGASGLLGSNIVHSTPSSFKIYGCDYQNIVNFKNCILKKIDITDYSQFKVIEEINPDLIIHCAARVSVDGNEKNPELAYQSNVIGTKNIVNLAEKLGCFLIHISTDAVFDGIEGDYVEDDKTNPINVYGETKLEAEKIIQKSNIDYCIARTNIYGWNKLDKFSLAEWMINTLEKGEKLNAFYDVNFTPTLVNNLAHALFEIYERNIQGVLHIAGSECINKYDYAKILADVFNTDKNLVKKISVDDIDLPAKRGKKLCLNTKKAQSLLETKLLNVKQGLEEMKKLKENGFVKKLKET